MDTQLISGITEEGKEVVIRVTDDGTLQSEITANNAGGFYPEAGIAPSDGINVDSDGNLMIRGAITTDEGGFREGFVGTSINKPLGTIKCTPNSNIVIGSNFTNGTIQIGDFIKLDADDNTCWVAIANINSDTELLLSQNYIGVGGTSAGSYTKLKPIIGSGGSITVNADQCIIGSGTTDNTRTALQRTIDYSPLIMASQINISQRIANQTAVLGFADDPLNPTTLAWFRFSGTSNAIVVCEAAFSNSAVKESVTVPLPTGLTTDKAQRYRIELTPEAVTFYIGITGGDDIKVARLQNNIPSPYAYMDFICGWINGAGVGSNSNMMVDFVYINNCNALQVQTSFPANTPIYVGNELSKLKDNFFNLNNWDITTHASDIIEFGGNVAGASYQKISKDPFILDTETKLISKFVVRGSMRIGLALSLSQRIAGQKFTYELAAVDSNGNIESTIPVATAVTCSSISQTTTTLTITTSTNHNLLPGDRVAVYGASDSRLNYGDLIVETIVSPTQFTTTNEQIGALPSVTTSSVVGFVIKKDPLSCTDNGFGILWEGTSATAARSIQRIEAGPFVQSAQSTFTSTDTIRGNTNGYCDALQPACQFDFRFKQDNIIIRSFSIDSLSGIGGTVKRSQCVPNINKNYKVIIRALNNAEGMSRPVTKIVSATKSGSAVATIVTDVPHNLTTGDYINIVGIRDQTNFANLTTATAVASVVNGTTFTISFSASYTGTSYGGMVIKMVGGHTSAVPNIAIQALSRTNNLLTLTGNTTWTGVGIGDTINVYGLYDTGGVSLSQYEGVYKVAYLSTTSLVLYSTGANVGSVNCGGGIVRRTDIRLHFFRANTFTSHIVDIDAGNGDTNDSQDSIPVALTASNAVVSVIPSQAAHDAAISGSPFRVAGRAVTTNYALVATGDTSDLITTLVGAIITRDDCIPEMEISNSITLTNNTDTSLFAGAGSGLKNYIKTLVVQNTHATVATTFIIKDNTTAKFTINLPANMSMPVVINFLNPIPMTANTVTNVACGTTGSNVLVNATGYKAP